MFQGALVLTLLGKKSIKRSLNKVHAFRYLEEIEAGREAT